MMAVAGLLLSVAAISGQMDARPVIPALAANPQQVQEDALVKQFEQNYGKQLLQINRTELHFMRIVCQPTKEQYETIAADSGSVIKATIRKCALQVYGRPGAGTVDPRRDFTETITRSISIRLSSEQADAYRKELEERAADRRKTIVRNLVVSMEKILLLTVEQRNKLHELLTDRWNDSWNQPRLFLMAGTYPSHLPDKEILALLTDSQQKAWRQMPKRVVGFGFNPGVAPGIELEEEVWEAPQPDAKRPPPGPAGEEEQEDRLVRVLGEQQAATEAEFESWVFQQHRTAVLARQQLTAELAMRIEDLDRMCQLTNLQKQKLQLLGRGDLKRFFNRYDMVQEKFRLINNNRERLQEIWPEISPLQVMLLAGIFQDDSLLYKSLPATLTAEQLAHYEVTASERRDFRHRACIELTLVLLEEAMPLRAQQRQRLIALMVEKIPPPRRSGRYDHQFILFHLGRLAEDRVKPLLTEIQWRVLSLQLAQGRNYEAILKQAGVLADEDDSGVPVVRPAAQKR